MSQIENIGPEFFIVSFIMPLIMAVILIWFVISYQRRKYKYEIEKKDHLVNEQKLIIEKQIGIEMERTRIAREMHDDLGSGLTTICFLTEKALRAEQNDVEKENIKKISTQASELVSNMSEIIWAMNHRFDDLSNFIGYIRRYASEFLSNHNLEFEFTTEAQNMDLVMSGEKRRNIFLVIKELLHNAVKYSKCKKICIDIRLDENLTVQIDEIEGIGFDPIECNEKGNGLYNIEKRISSIGGHLNFQRKEEMMTTQIIYPIIGTE